MEDNKTQAIRPQTNTGQVMDIQPPRAGASKVAAAPVAAPPHVEEAANKSPQPAKPAEAPAPQTAQKPVPPASSDDKPDSAVPNLLAIPELTAPKKDHRILLITTALIVSLTLAGLSVFAYLQADKYQDVRPAGGTVEQDAEHPATQDLDGADKEVDEAIGTFDDEADFSEGDLSDKTLGLE